MSAKVQSKQEPLPMQDVIRAIPVEINEETPLKDPLGDLISQIGSRKVPVHSLTRLWALGSMQAKIAVGYLAYAMRSVFSDKNEKERLLNETHLSAALKLLGTMGYLRGAVMKVGQLLANLPHIVPEEMADTLERLQFEAPPMHYSLIREVFLDEFGKDPGEIFASFEKKAFAAASLGQVHRAVLKTGEEVAVKIQYPNMAATIRADLNNLRKILLPMKLKKEGRYLADHLQDIESVLTAETDYLGEAESMRMARELFREENRIVVPRVWKEYTTERVLTTDFLRGCHPGEFIKGNPEQTARDQFGTLISRAIFRIWVRAHAMYADPNPGNFLLLDDGRLGLIDFGCYRILSEEEWQRQVEAENAFMGDDMVTMDKIIAEACLFAGPEQMEPQRLKLLRSLSLWQAQPVAKPGKFDFGNREYYQQGIDLYTEATRKGYIRNSPLYIWWTRLIFGHRTLLYRMNSTVDYHEIYHSEKNY